MEFSFDTDPKQAANSRVKMLDMLAANKIPVLAYHYPWPAAIEAISPKRLRASTTCPSRCR